MFYQFHDDPRDGCARAQPVMKVGQTRELQVQRHDEGQVAAHGEHGGQDETPLSWN